MAITGSGTQADPWVVTTYAELVEKANDEGYIKIGNNINIIDEYPDGDMPTLEIVNSNIDGDGKVISNWYKTNSGNCVTVSGSSQVTDLHFCNIYDLSGEFCVLNGYNEDYHFVNCKFNGRVASAFMIAIDDGRSSRNFKSCSFYIDSRSSYGAFVSNVYSYIGIKDCYLKVISSSAPSVFGSSASTSIENCYIESNIPCGAYGYISNSVLDITSTETFTAGNSGNDLSIINSTHAPNMTAGTGFAAVDDTHWLDVSYLQGIGFNIA